MAAARSALSSQQRPGVEGAGRAQRDQLAVAVAGGHVGPDAGRGEQGVRGEPDDAQRGLRDPGVGDARPLRVAGPASSKAAGGIQRVGVARVRARR